LKRFPPPVLIDEIQYAPNLFPYIKMVCDQIQKPNLFWLTGSQQFHLMQNVTESLAGRVGIMNLLGFSNRENTGHSDAPPFLPQADHPVFSKESIFKNIWRGSFPAMVLNKEMDHTLFYSSYVQTYLQRDVRALTQVGDEMIFLRFLKAAAARTGQLLNMAELARDVGVTEKTAKNWLSILEASGIIYLLQPFHTNITKRLVKSPKFYFLDTGLVCYLTNWLTPETLENGAMSGAIFETWCFIEILKSYWHNGQQAPFYFYRDQNQKEIDLLIVQNNECFPIEFKKTASPARLHAASFNLLNKLIPINHGAIVCQVEQTLPLAKNLTAIPVLGL
jgi:predicted AAA+ superfamily ATPase